MLSKKHKLTRKDVDRLFEDKRALHSPSFTFKYQKSPEIKETGFSVSVSKKIIRTAPARNNTKRRVYYVLTKLFDDIKTPIHGMFIVKKPISDLSSADIQTEIELLLKKAHII